MKLSLKKMQDLLTDINVINVTMQDNTVTVEYYDRNADTTEQAVVEVATRTIKWLQENVTDICIANMGVLLYKEGHQPGAALDVLLADGKVLRYAVRCFHEEMARILSHERTHCEIEAHEAYITRKRAERDKADAESAERAVTRYATQRERFERLRKDGLDPHEPLAFALQHLYTKGARAHFIKGMAQHGVTPRDIAESDASNIAFDVSRRPHDGQYVRAVLDASRTLGISEDTLDKAMRLVHA